MDNDVFYSVMNNDERNGSIFTQRKVTWSFFVYMWQLAVVFLDGGYIAARFMLVLTWQSNYVNTNCRNTETLAGDLAETSVVPFLTKIESQYFVVWKTSP